VIPLTLVHLVIPFPYPQLYEDDSEEDWSNEEAMLTNEFKNYKRNYYRNKFKREAQGQLLEELGHHYVNALQWVLDYYYRGVQSWDWYYPFHYAPFISDLKNIEQVQIDFQLGTPFLPFQQVSTQNWRSAALAHFNLFIKPKILRMLCP